MKVISIFLWVVGVVAVQAMLSAQTQPSWLSERITLRIKDGRLPDILASVQKVADFRLEVAEPNRELLQARITIDTCGESIENVLKAVLFPAGLSFTVADDKTVHVFRPDSPPTPVTVKGCEDGIDDRLKRLLGVAPPPPFELSTPKPAKPNTP